MPAAPTLRPARDADRDAVRALVEAALHEHGLEPDRGGRDADLAALEAEYAGRGGAFSVLIDADGAVIGCVGLYRLDAARAELRKMYLAPAARGRGHGRLLLEHALATARRLGVARVELETARVLARAIALYRAYGFEPIEHDAPCAQRCELAFVLDLDRALPVGSTAPSHAHRP